MKLKRTRLAATALAVIMGAALLTSCSASSSSSSSTSTAGADGSGRTGCYPATPKHPLESTVVVNTSGGTLGDALTQAYFAGFEKQCGVKVEQYNAATETFAQVQQFATGDNAPYDLGNTYTPEMFAQGEQAGIFKKLPSDFWNEYKGQMIPGSYDQYGAWGYVAIRLMITNTQQLPNGLTTWADFFNGKKYPGARGVQDYARSAIIMALLAKGYKQDQIYPMTWSKVNEAFTELNKIKPYIGALMETSDQPVSSVGSGNLVAAWANTARSLPAIQQGEPIKVNYSAGGDAVSYSWYVIKNAKHPLAAEALLHYMQNAKRQADFYKLFNYSAGNADAAKYLTGDLKKQFTSQSKLFTSTLSQQAWWAANDTALQNKWNAWKASSGFGSAIGK
jgi:putative spermidine/putrescine transport system substrate-binding protein